MRPIFRNDVKGRPRPPVDPTRYQNPDEDPRGPWLAMDLTSPIARPLYVYELEGQLPPEGRSWRYSQDRMAELQSEGRLILRAGWRPPPEALPG